MNGLPECPDWCERDRDAGDLDEQVWLHTRSLVEAAGDPTISPANVTLEQSWRWDQLGRMLRDPAEIVIRQTGHEVSFPADEAMLRALSRGFAFAAETLHGA